MKNFFPKYKLLISVLVLCVWALVSITIISHYKKKIKLQDYEISELNYRVDELENEKEDLKNQVREFEHNINNNKTIHSQRNKTNQLGSNFGKTEINESEVYSAQGHATVVFRKRGCDYMILENSYGYVVAEWMGGDDPDQGDNIGGDLNSYGMNEFYNLSKNLKINLWVDDYMLSKDRALEKISDKCD